MTSQILNVVIVLIATYIALSVACSFLQEQLAAWLRLRPKALAEGIAQLVSRDPETIQHITTHPLIGDAPPDKPTGTQIAATFPSYIDPRSLQSRILADGRETGRARARGKPSGPS
jgi:hypothetical protein